MSRRNSLRLLVLVGLVLGMVGSAQVLPARKVSAQDVHALAVTVDGTVTTKTSTTGATVSWSHTTGAGTDRLTLVGVSWNASGTAVTISSVTFTPTGGSAIPLSLVIVRQNTWLYRYAAIYSLVGPDAGQAGTMTVTFPSSITTGVVAGAVNFAGVDQTTPFGPAKGADGVSSAPSVTLTGLASGDLVFDNLFVGGTGSTTSATVGAGQSQLTGWNTYAQTARGAASTEQAAGSSVVMDWLCGTQSSPTTPTAYIWVDVAVPINPPCTGSRYNLTVGNDGNGTVTLNPPGGSYCAGRIVTLTPTPNSGYLFSGWVGANAGDIVNTGGVYTIVMDGDKSVTANFAQVQAPTCPNNFSQNASSDTYLSAAATTTNYGNTTPLLVDRGTTTSRRTALLKWNVSSIPANATVSSASIVLEVSDSCTYAYPLYDVTKPWVEGTGAAGSGATWMTYDGTVAWGISTGGASQTSTGSIDRATTNLWTSTGGFAAGSKTLALNSSGVAVVQRWVSRENNNGVIIQDYAGTTDPLGFHSKEGATPPTLSVNYCLPSNTAPGATNVAPLDAATGITAPMLSVDVSDSNSNVMSVTFWGRVFEAGALGHDASSLADFAVVGSVHGIAGSGNASLYWGGLTAGTHYEWYAVVTDGANPTTGPTWDFTTSDPTEAELTSLAANAARGSILLRWDTASEQGNLGFHVWRASSTNGERERLTASLIPSQAPGSATAGRYQFVDETAFPGLTYYYWVERVGLDGATQLHGPVSARASLYIKVPPPRN